MGYIYKITNKINGKIYIGKTEETIERRFYEHKLTVKIGKKQNKLYSAMKKYGVENFIVEEIDQSDNRDELCEKEIWWIKELKSQDPSIGYNIADGGNGGYTWDQKGTVTLHKNDRNTHVRPEDVDKYIEDGWELGGKKLGKSTNRSIGKWIHKDDIQTRVYEYELEDYLNDGWILGYCDSAKENLSKSHKGCTPYNKGVPMKDSQKEKLRTKMGGYRWMNKDGVQTEVMKDKVEEYLDNGWVFGRINNGRKKGGDVNE